MEYSPKRHGAVFRICLEISRGAVRRFRVAKARIRRRAGGASWLGKGLGRDFRDHSDAELRAELRGMRGDPDSMHRVFGLVAEALRRRLGAWRAFDAGVDHRAMSRFRSTARGIVASGLQGSHRMLDGMELDPDERAIVSAMVYVEERSRVENRGNILLPADFYRAVDAKDPGGALTFAATREQLLAGALMHDGRVVEMNAGEGKTIAAAFPAVAQVASGRRVHVITANDYLALRDAEWLAPVYQSLGVTVRAVLGHMSDDERRDAYRAEIVYGTVRELGFDFLRDNLRYSRDEMVQGLLDVAIVDEADQVLIDEARTPLIISGGATSSVRSVHKIGNAVRDMVSLQARTVAVVEDELRRSNMDQDGYRVGLAKLLLADPRSDVLLGELARDGRLYRRVRDLARDAASGEDTDGALLSDLYYHLDLEHDLMTLTDRGQEHVERWLGPLFDTTALEAEIDRTESDDDAPLDRRRGEVQGLRRRISRRRSQMNQVHQSLRAHLLLQRDEDYVVVDGEVVLVDRPTGRSRADSRYQHGLQAALEAKEGVTVRAESEVLGQISVQGFIGRYRSVAGMTGTALASEDELRRGYGLRVSAVPPTRRSKRADLPTRLYPSRREKLEAVVRQAALCQRVGRPVLVGTLTVEQSEEISRLLAGHGVEHRVLNAVNSAEEAQVVRSAGKPGAVTVATNMAGRGTDILLEPGLNGKILRGYLDLGEELLAGGLDSVVLECATSDEAEALDSAMSAHPTLDSNIARRNGAWEARITSPGPGGRSSTTGPDAGKTVRLEFGLGLYVIGTEMNDSSRIDQQLRGRGGRQGERGSSRFVLSLEDRALALRSEVHAAAANGSDGSFADGAATQRRLERAQARTELEDEAGRAAMSDFYRVLEEQTLARYRDRRRVMDSDRVYETCAELMGRQARRVVERHLPPRMIGEYAARFDEIAEEVWLDYDVDCRTLWGLGVDALAKEMGRLMVERLEGARAAIGVERFDAVARVTLLQTGDELWRDQLAHLDELLVGTMLCSQGHRAAVAEYQFRCVAAYRLYIQEVAGCFLPRLLAVADSASVERTATAEPRLVKDIQEILA